MHNRRGKHKFVTRQTFVRDKAVLNWVHETWAKRLLVNIGSLFARSYEYLNVSPKYLLLRLIVSSVLLIIWILLGY